MTGQHPGKVHCRGNGDEDHFALDPEMITLPRLFKNAGYAAGAFGKWGLGTTSKKGPSNPQSHGFDHFSGWKSQMIAHTYYPTSIVRDGKEERLEKGTYIHDLIMADASEFIRRSAESKTPFFCYIPTAVPHAAMHAPEEDPETASPQSMIRSKRSASVAKSSSPKGNPQSTSQPSGGSGRSTQLRHPPYFGP